MGRRLNVQQGGGGGGHAGLVWAMNDGIWEGRPVATQMGGGSTDGTGMEKGTPFAILFFSAHPSLLSFLLLSYQHR
jgi:hypothetical protein